jgi:hypothetical protein
MPDYILHQAPGSAQWERVPESEFKDEGALQDIIMEHPETLPLDGYRRLHMARPGVAECR